MNNIKLLNNEIEVALRILILLNTISNAIDEQLIIFYDYALLHSSDFDKKQPSILPNSPFRKEELSIKTKLIKNALKILAQKQLIDVIYNEKGIYYLNNELTNLFINKLTSAYSKKLIKQAKWVKKHFMKYNEQNIKIYFEKTMSKWDSEFSVYGLFNEDYDYAK